MKDKKSLILINIITLILVGTGLFFIYSWQKENKKNNDLQDQLIDKSNIQEEKDKYPYITTDITNLLKENKDTIGWLQVPNTNINYPIVQSKDNDYYLQHNYENIENTSGWVFLDYRNKTDASDTNQIIYGHNRLDNSMFGTLKNTLEEAWYKENKYIYFNTKETYNTYEVFSIYKIHKEEFQSLLNFTSNESYQNYLSDSISKSIYNFQVDVQTTDKIITLYTCDNDNEYRTILQAKLVQQKDATK